MVFQISLICHINSNYFEVQPSSLLRKFLIVRKKLGLGIFLSPSVYIEEKRSEFFKVPESIIYRQSSEFFQVPETIWRENSVLFQLPDPRVKLGIFFKSQSLYGRCEIQCIEVFIHILSYFRHLSSYIRHIPSYFPHF